MKRRVDTMVFPDRNAQTRKRIMDTKSPTGLTATLEPAQWDKLGSLLVAAHTTHKNEVNALEPILDSLRRQLQPKPPVANGKPHAVADLPEVVPEPDQPSA
jgi:hypothetical protein